MKKTEDIKTEDTEIDIEDIGTILKSSRLKGKNSLEEISSELCIRKIYLTAIEEGDYETLPPVPYGIGYVRTYAKYLGLNPERAVKLYKAAALKEDAENKEAEPEITPEAKTGNYNHILVAILALAVIYSGWSLYVSEIKEKSDIKEVAITDEQLLSEPENGQDKITEYELDDDNAEESMNNDDNKEAQTDVTEETPQIKAREEKPESTQASTLPKDKIVLVFSGESWVELKDKNKVYLQGVFHNGDKKELNYVKNLFLSVGRPSNLTMYVNGKQKDVLAKHRKSNIPVDSLD